MDEGLKEEIMKGFIEEVTLEPSLKDEGITQVGSSHSGLREQDRGANILALRGVSGQGLERWQAIHWRHPRGQAVQNLKSTLRSVDLIHKHWGPPKAFKQEH